jgi:type VI secretion system protein ImpA
MATPPIIAVEEWLVPIPGVNPSGRNLAYEPEFDAIRNARRSEDATLQGDWKHEAKTADWDAVLALSESCLRTKTKDLQAAAWVTEALARLHGFAGVRDGLGLLRGIQSRFWDTYSPEIDDGDLESRYGPFVFLNDARMLPYLILNTPLTRGLDVETYSYLRYRESRETDNLIKKNPDKAKTILAERRITAKVFDDQVSQTPRRFYETLVDDLRQAIDAFRAFDEDTDARFGKLAPSIMNVGKALDDCLRLLEPILAAKRLQEPDPEVLPGPDEPDVSAAVPAVVVDVVSRGADVSASTEAPTTSADPGRVLIEFRALAQSLAEAGMKLEENRKKYAELQAELKRLDREYEEISRSVGRCAETHRLLSRVLELQGRG